MVSFCGYDYHSLLNVCKRFIISLHLNVVILISILVYTHNYSRMNLTRYSRSYIEQLPMHI